LGGSNGCWWAMRRHQLRYPSRRSLHPPQRVGQVPPDPAADHAIKDRAGVTAGETTPANAATRIQARTGIAVIVMTAAAARLAIGASAAKAVSAVREPG
jgi:hypothetical protein